jgi:hypothetical protein
MRPFNRRQSLENAAFLAALRRTGNPRLAAAELGVHRSTYLKRRAGSAAFASEWDAAILACHAALGLGGGPRPPEGNGLRTVGGEIMVGRTRGGRLQLRRAPPGRMTQAGEQCFFRALAASVNVRLSAAVTGFTHSAFYQRKRAWPAFAAEMKLSLTIGYDRIECAAMERTLQALHGGGPDNAWLDRAIGEDIRSRRSAGTRPSSSSASTATPCASTAIARPAAASTSRTTRRPPISRFPARSTRSSAECSRKRPAAGASPTSSPHGPFRRSAGSPAGARPAPSRATTRTSLCSAAGGSRIGREGSASGGSGSGEGEAETIHLKRVAVALGICWWDTQGSPISIKI